jgi:membrane protein YdbS with pleckstrin-like domain
MSRVGNPFLRFQELVLRLLKVPPQPQAPAGTPGSIQVFRASRGYFHLKLVEWGFKQVATAIGIIVFLSVVSGGFLPVDKLPIDKLPVDMAGLRAALAKVQTHWPLTVLLLRVVEVVSIAGFVMQIPFTLALVRLDYLMRFYIVTDRSLRIRDGVRHVREMTMTYANVQEITIRQGPVQRLLGFADLRVRSAGGGGQSEISAGEEEAEAKSSMHLAYFRGVDNAEEIRGVIRSHLSRLRDGGLGDPDDLPAEPMSESDDSTTATSLTDAAEELLAEARLLRQSLEQWPEGGSYSCASP